ncbi:MAG TPA: hypothetical protein VNZ50_05970 [Hyphomicrobiaceae bacterium]|nr:hypothetical protein [Hyphomicrobiaceae bacterium]
MKKTLMAAAFALAGAGFALPTQASAAALTPGLANGASVDSSMAVQVRDYYRGRRYYRGGYRPRYAYRHWHRRPYYGRIVGGIALGALLAGSAYYAYNAPPAPGLCWFWADPYERHGYWDYC